MGRKQMKHCRKTKEGIKNGKCRTEGEEMKDMSKDIME